MSLERLIAGRRARAAILAAAVICTALAAAPAALGADDPELRGQWHLDAGALAPGDDSVSATYDSSGNDHTAIVRYTNPAPGRFGGAFRFINNSLVETGGPLLRPEHLTVVAWVRADAAPGNLRYIVAQGGSDGCIPAAYGLYTGAQGQPNAGGISFYVTHAGAAYHAAGLPAANVWDGAWHMLAGTFDGTKARFYLDGTEIGDGMHDGTAVPGPIDYSQPMSSFRIGRYGRAFQEPCAGAITAFNGNIDEVRIYGRALTGSEIAALAAPSWTTPPPVGEPPPGPPPPPPPDTTPPVTSITVGPPEPVAAGYYPDQVGVLVSATDAPGMFETRCVLDPLFPPSEFADMAPGCSFSSRAFVISEGTHTMYAASRDGVGNVERPLVTRTFRLLPTPRTTILEGPTGDTWVNDPVFSFAATISGSTFECRVDNQDWGPCSSPYQLAALASGPHTFSVRATSPAGATELVPPHRNISVNPSVRVREGCAVDPVVHEYLRRLVIGTPQHACLVGRPTAPCEPGLICVPRELVCPRGARCTITTRAAWYDDDRGAIQGAAAWASVGRPEFRLASFYRTLEHRGDPVAQDICFTAADEARCNVQTRLVVLGDDRPLYGGCEWTVGSLAGWGVVRFGADEARRITCAVTMTTEPTSPLFTVANGTGVVTHAPSAGLIVATWTLSPGMARVRAAASRPRIATSRVTVERSGAVAILPRLNPAAKRKLRRTRKLTASVRLAFTPRDGSPVIRTQRVTLRRVVSPRRICLPAKPGDPRSRRPVPKRC